MTCVNACRRVSRAKNTVAAFVLERGGDVQPSRLDLCKQFSGHQASRPCGVWKVLAGQFDGLLYRKPAAVRGGLDGFKIRRTLCRRSRAIAFSDLDLRH